MCKILLEKISNNNSNSNRNSNRNPNHIKMDITIWTVARVIFSIIFAGACWFLYSFLETISQNKECPLADGWRVSNGKLIATLMMAIWMVNIIIPANKFLAGLPIIGSSYVLLFVLALFMLIFIVNRISVNLIDDPDNENNSCLVDELDPYSTLIEWFGDLSFLQDVYITIITAMLFFYL